VTVINNAEPCTVAGADPRGLPDYQALCEEMARLGHPACPDVQWRCVEQRCLRLFACNGPDLQTAAWYVLARSHLDGLDGLVQGLNVMETLVAAGANPWPRGLSARADIFRRLFVLLQAPLRSTALDTRDLPRLGLIDRQLVHLHQRLISQPAGALNSLEGLRQQIARLACRIERDAREQARRGADASIKPPDAHAAEHSAVPGMGREIKSARRPDTKPAANRRGLVWLACLGTALLVLLAAFTGS
jgi:predicted component of type VI protein secretion system